MGDFGKKSDTQQALEKKEQQQEAVKTQQQTELREKSIQTLKRKQASFAGTTPTSLFSNGNGNTTLG